MSQWPLESMHAVSKNLVTQPRARTTHSYRWHGAAGGDRAPLLRRRRDPAVAHHVLSGTGWLSGGGERKGEDGRPILSGGA